jgi:hypothetical protein
LDADELKRLADAIDYLLRGYAGFAQGAKAQGVVALGEAVALSVEHEWGVEVGGGWEVQGALQEDLAGGGFEEVAAADYFGDAGVGVIDDAGELVAGEVVFAPDEEVAEVDACGKGLGAEVLVVEADDFAVGDAEAVVGVGLEGCFDGLVVEREAADVGVDTLVIGFVGGVVVVGGVHHGGEVFAAAAAGVDLAGEEELVEGFAIEREALGLRDDGWGPGDAEPGYVFEHGGDEFGAGAVRVEVFVAEQESAVVIAGASEGLPEGGGVAQVQKTCGARGQSADVGAGHFSMISGDN